MVGNLEFIGMQRSIDGLDSLVSQIQFKINISGLMLLHFVLFSLFFRWSSEPRRVQARWGRDMSVMMSSWVHEVRCPTGSMSMFILIFDEKLGRFSMRSHSRQVTRCGWRRACGRGHRFFFWEWDPFL